MDSRSPNKLSALGGSLIKTNCNAGILEVKIQKRLKAETNAIPVGVSHAGTRQRKGHKKKPRRLPHLPPDSTTKLSTSESSELLNRPMSFATEREEAMNAVGLPLPARSVVKKHVNNVKISYSKSAKMLPPVSGIYSKSSKTLPSTFSKAYKRNELPVMIEPTSSGPRLKWLAEIASLEYGLVLPQFLDGIRERSFPYCFLAKEGSMQLLQFGAQRPSLLAECLPRVVLALRAAMESRHAALMLDAMYMLRLLTAASGIGPLLVPYYRQLLPMMSIYKNQRRNLGDQIDFKQSSKRELGDAVMETLELLEQTGGPDAFVNIKYMIPTYESQKM